ncbi:MAG: glutathione S-transferase family protein [Rhodospirillales bacterium]|nr:glutathione S-transferase family protein [Rhodospirillales bacterium]
MSDFILYIGNKTYSSWSWRGWLACKIAGISFVEKTIPLQEAGFKEAILKISPSGRVPTLHHGRVAVWESLAIAEYLAELRPEAGIWPAETTARAHARVISAEMHAGFAELRTAMWMNIRRRFPGKRRTPGALADIARIAELWRETRAAFGQGGPFLFGRRFNFADAMYTPVVARFVTWEPELPADAKAYVEAVWAQPWVREWCADAAAEPWTIARDEDPDRPH